MGTFGHVLDPYRTQYLYILDILATNVPNQREDAILPKASRATVVHCPPINIHIFKNRNQIQGSHLDFMRDRGTMLQ